jgi:hypothetical protein
MPRNDEERAVMIDYFKVLINRKGASIALLEEALLIEKAYFSEERTTLVLSDLLDLMQYEAKRLIDDLSKLKDNGV